MPGENAELVRRGYELWNRDGTMEGMMALVSPEFEWHPNPDDPEQRVRRGQDEVRAAMGDLNEAFERLDIDVEELIEVDDSIVVVVHHRALGRGSGAEVERREVHVWTFDGEVAVRLDEYGSREDALAAIDA